MGNESLINEIISSINMDGDWVGRVPRSIVQKDTINPRKHRNPKKFAATKSDVEAKGISQALLLRLNPNTETHLPLLVVAGEGRFIIAEELNLDNIPVKIERLSDQDAKAKAASENMFRNDMTPIEEADFAEIRLIECKNDMDSVASELGWSASKLKSRLLLTRATEGVRKALAEGEIVLGHAELLCSLTDDAQSRFLPIIIDKALSAKETRTHIEALERDLSKACFDTSSCQGCKHNTSSYVDLFDSASTGGKCRSSSCWDGKVEEQIVKIVDDSKLEYGTVRQDNEVTEGSVIKLVETGATGVGTSQLSACSGCEHYGCIISTKLGVEGTVTAPVCFNTTCHAEKVSDYQKILADVSADTVSSTVTESTKDSPDLTKKSNPVKKSSAKPAQSSDAPKALKLIAYREMAKAASTSVETAPHVNKAITLYRLINQSDHEVRKACNKAAESIGLNITHSVREPVNLSLLIEATDSQLEKLELALNQAFIALSDNTEAFHSNDRRGMALLIFDYLQVDLTKFWSVDAEYLGKLTKANLKDTCEKSGFTDAFDKDKGDKAFTSLFKAKMPEILKGVTDFEFNWKGYLPPVFDFRKAINSVKLKNGNAPSITESQE